MKTESSLATLAAVAGDCTRLCWATASIHPALSLARGSSERESAAPARGTASVVLWRHLRAEFTASEATEGRLSWLLWSAGVVAIGCFLAVVL